MTEPTRILYITCSNQHPTRRVAKVVPREDFESIFTEPTAAKTKGIRLIWVNTPATSNLRAASEMPSGTTDLDRKAIIICFSDGCRHAVGVSEGTIRRVIYEPAILRGQKAMDISELERIVNDVKK